MPACQTAPSLTSSPTRAAATPWCLVCARSAPSPPPGVGERHDIVHSKLDAVHRRLGNHTARARRNRDAEGLIQDVIVELRVDLLAFGCVRLSGSAGYQLTVLIVLE